MMPRITSAQADTAAERAARFWPEIGARWPWTRAADVGPVYRMVGEQIVALLRALPPLQWSNQALWYQRDIRDTPAVLVLAPDALQVEVERLTSGAQRRAVEGKQVFSLMYPVADDALLAGQPAVARTLLASTAATTPLFAAQLAHEILNCFCFTEWDGQTLRSGVRQTIAPAQPWTSESGAALNDLLLDAILVNVLPAVTNLHPEDLFESAQGPYWRLAQTLATRLRGVPTLPALFSGANDTRQRYEHGLAVALDDSEAAAKIDRLVTSHDWAALGEMLGAER